MKKITLLILALLMSHISFAASYECPSQSELKKAFEKKGTAATALSKDGIEYKIKRASKNPSAGAFTFSLISIFISKETTSLFVTCKYKSDKPEGGNVFLSGQIQSSDKENFAFRPNDPDLWLPENKQEVCRKSSEACMFYL